MPDNENAPQTVTGRRQRENALQLGPRKKPYVILRAIFICNHDPSHTSCVTDPLVHHGRHFGRTIHALSTVHALLTNGLWRIGEHADQPEESFTAEFVLLPPSNCFIPI